MKPNIIVNRPQLFSIEIAMLIDFILEWKLSDHVQQFIAMNAMEKFFLKLELGKDAKISTETRWCMAFDVMHFYIPIYFSLMCRSTKYITQDDS